MLHFPSQGEKEHVGCCYEMLQGLRSAIILFYNPKHAVQSGVVALKSVFMVHLLWCCVKPHVPAVPAGCHRGEGSHRTLPLHLLSLLLISDMHILSRTRKRSSNSYEKRTPSAPHQCRGIKPMREQLRTNDCHWCLPM